MNITAIIPVISLVIALANGIGMILMYLRYNRVIRGSFAVLQANEEGEVQILDLLPDSSHPPIR